MGHRAHVVAGLEQAGDEQRLVVPDRVRFGLEPDVGRVLPGQGGLVRLQPAALAGVAQQLQALFPQVRVGVVQVQQRLEGPDLRPGVRVLDPVHGGDVEVGPAHDVLLREPGGLAEPA